MHRRHHRRHHRNPGLPGWVLPVVLVGGGLYLLTRRPAAPPPALPGSQPNAPKGGPSYVYPYRQPTGLYRR